jgi:hypothetical protein
MNLVDRNSRKILFLVTSIYVLEVLCYIKKYKGDLKRNCEIHEYNTRSK